MSDYQPREINSQLLTLQQELQHDLSQASDRGTHIAITQRLERIQRLLDLCAKLETRD